MSANSQQLRFDKGTLVLDSEPPAGVARHFERDSRIEAWRCDALHYSEVNLALKEMRLSDSYASPAKVVIQWPRSDLPPLRSDQASALQAWMATRRGVLVMPTGTGKTEVALHIMQRLSVPTLIVSPVRDLMYQWHQRIQDRLGYDAGVIGDNTFNKRPISVTTYDSACIHMRDFGNEFELLIFDECHHLPGQVRSDAARMSIAPYRLGLTATPERSDGRESILDMLIGPVVFRYALSEARGRTLAEYEVKKIPVYLSPAEQENYDLCSGIIRHFMSERRKEDRDYTFAKLLAEYAKCPEARRAYQAYRTNESIEDRAHEKLRVLEDLFRLHKGQRILVFTKTNVMAREVSVRFLIPSLLHHCRKKERKDILDGFREGRYTAIVANQVLDEGVDLPEAKIAVVLGGWASKKQAKQRLGRILRKRGDETAILYEVICQDTKEVERSRQRRRSDAYEGTRNFRIRS